MCPVLFNDHLGLSTRTWGAWRSQPSWLLCCEQQKVCHLNVWSESLTGGISGPLSLSHPWSLCPWWLAACQGKWGSECPRLPLVFLLRPPGYPGWEHHRVPAT